MKNILFKLKRFLSKLASPFKSTKVQVVYDKDLEKLLTSINELENVHNSIHHCHSCKKVITLDNLTAFFREEGKYHFLCEDSICLSKYLDQ